MQLSRDLLECEATTARPPDQVARRGWNHGIESLLLVVLVIIFIWKGFRPSWSSLDTDFPNYYLVARSYSRGYPLKKLYDWTWTQ